MRMPTGPVLADDQRIGEGLCVGRGSEGRRHGGDGGRAGAGLEIADGGAGEGDGDLGVGVGRDVIHVEERLEAVVAGEVDGGLAADQGDGVAAGVDGVDGLDGGVKRDNAGDGCIGADDESGARVRRWCWRTGSCWSPQPTSRNTERSRGAALRHRAEMRERSRCVGGHREKSLSAVPGKLIENAAPITEDQGPDAVGGCAQETRKLGAARL